MMKTKLYNNKDSSNAKQKRKQKNYEIRIALDYGWLAG